jgi:hypothetical protein
VLHAVLRIAALNGDVLRKSDVAVAEGIGIAQRNDLRAGQPLPVVRILNAPGSGDGPYPTVVDVVHHLAVMLPSDEPIFIGIGFAPFVEVTVILGTGNGHITRTNQTEILALQTGQVRRGVKRQRNGGVSFFDFDEVKDEQIYEKYVYKVFVWVKLWALR